MYKTFYKSQKVIQRTSPDEKIKKKIERELNTIGNNMNRFDDSQNEDINSRSAKNLKGRSVANRAEMVKAVSLK